MRMLVLSRNASLYSTSRIVLAARARGHEVTVIDPLDFQIVVSRGRSALYLSGALVGKADVVIPRIGASITNYGLAVVRQFDMMGVPVLNTAVAIARSRDKLRALQLLTGATSTFQPPYVRDRLRVSTPRSIWAAGAPRS